MTLFSKIKRYWNQIKGLFPSALPVGRTEFEVWSQSIFDTYDLPTKDLRSVRFTLTTILMSLKTTDSLKPKYYFVKVCRAAAAKQVAGAIWQEIKLAQQAEATASTQAVANERPGTA